MTRKEIADKLSAPNGYDWLKENIGIFEPPLYPTRVLLQLADEKKIAGVRFKNGEPNYSRLARWGSDELNKTQFRCPSGKNPTDKFQPGTVREWITSKNPDARDFPKEHLMKLLIIFKKSIDDSERYLTEAYPESGKTVFDFKNVEHLVYYYCIFNGKSIDDAYRLNSEAEKILKTPEAKKRIEQAYVEFVDNNSLKLEKNLTRFTTFVHANVKARVKARKLSNDDELLEFIAEKAHYFRLFNNTAYAFLHQKYLKRRKTLTHIDDKLGNIYTKVNERANIVGNCLIGQDKPIGRRLFIEVLMAFGENSSGEIDGMIDKFLLEGKLNAEILEDAVVILACAQTQWQHGKNGNAFDNYVKYRKEFIVEPNKDRIEERNKKAKARRDKKKDKKKEAEAEQKEKETEQKKPETEQKKVATEQKKDAAGPVRT